MRIESHAVLIVREPGDEAVTPGSAILALEARGGVVGASVVARTGPARRGTGFADLMRQCESGRGRVMSLPAGLVEMVGHWDSYTGTIRLLPRGDRALSRWLGHPVHRDDLEAADSRDNVRRDARAQARRLAVQGRSAESMALRAWHGISGW